MAVPESLRGLAAGGFELLHQRLELASLDLEEQALRVGRMLALLFVAVGLGMLALVGVGATIVVWFWDSARMAALLGVTGVLLLATAAIVRALWVAAASHPAFLAATLEELRRDRQALRKTNEPSR